MDETQPKTTKPISDDQELAKVLAGVTQEADNLNFEETPASQSTPNLVAPVAPQPLQNQTATYNNPAETTPNQAIGDLDVIKKDALTELRPLVDKLDLAPDEKFDTYLLLIRSTDDTSLIAPAHTAAKNIPDETRRAQALLDIIKEIDYLSAPEQPSI
jgi:hypothetical protein